MPGIRGRSGSPPSGRGPVLHIPPLQWQDLMETSLPPHFLPGSLSGYNPSTHSRFGVVVLQHGATPSGRPLVHWLVVVWLGCLGLWLFVPRFFFLGANSTSFGASEYSGWLGGAASEYGGWLGGLTLHDVSLC